MFKICIIGCGWVSNFGHGPAYQKYAKDNPDVELTACCDIDEKKARLFKEKYGFKKYDTDYIKMLKKEKPDVVCLNVPASLIVPFSKEILKEGYPLLLEKPPGINPEETLSLINVAEKTATPHMVAFNRRFMPLIQIFKKTIQEKIDLNDIQNIQYNLFRYNRTESNFEITTIHGIDTVRYLTDSDYKKVEFYYQEFPELGENVMNIYMHCEMKSGAKAILSFCPVSGVIVERTIVNSHNYSFFMDIPVWDSIDISGEIICVEKNEIIRKVNFNDNRQNVDDFQRYGFYNEDKIFFDSIRSGKSLLPDVKSSLQTIEICECIRVKQKEYH
jgi:predicted dehydrogenase